MQDRYTNFQVAPSDFVGYTGNWYLLKADGTTAQTGLIGTPAAVFNVQDPTLEVAAWDFVQANDVTGKSVPQGTHLGIQVKTNMYAATYANRNNTIFNDDHTCQPGSICTSAVMPDGSTSITNLNYHRCLQTAHALKTPYTGSTPDVNRVINYLPQR